MQARPILVHAATAQSAQPRRPVRANGRTRYAVLLDAAERLVAREGAAGLSIQNLAREAGVPMASVYHFFPEPAAISVALAERYFDGLEVAICAPIPDLATLAWWQIIRIVNRRGVAYYRAHPYAQTLILGSDHSWAIRSADLANNRRIAEAIAGFLSGSFAEVPAERLLEAVVVGVSIGDALFTLSIADTGSISEAMADEAWLAACAYIAAKFGLSLPPST